MACDCRLIVPALPAGSRARPLVDCGYPYPVDTAAVVDDYADKSKMVMDRIYSEIKGVEFPSTFWNSRYFRITTKLMMLFLVRDFFRERGFEFDEFNGATPAHINKYFAYEFSALWLWTEMIFSSKSGCDFGNCFYLKYQYVIEASFKKYPDIMTMLSGELDLRVPGNKFLDFASLEGY